VFWSVVPFEAFDQTPGFGGWKSFGECLTVDGEIVLDRNDTGATATIYLALTTWIFGGANRAQELADEATSRALGCNHVPTVTTTSFFKVLFEAISDRADATRTDAKALIQLTREHATPMFLSLAIIFQGWARARLGERDAGLADLCEGLTNYARQGNRTFLPLIWGLLAGIEAESRGAEGGLTRVDEALALAVETGEHWTDSFLHRVRAKSLLETHQTPFRLRKPFSPPLRSRSSRRRRALSCKQPYHLRSFTDRPTAPRPEAGRGGRCIPWGGLAGGTESSSHRYVLQGRLDQPLLVPHVVREVADVV
jgi:hypothetical protein